MKFLFLLDMIVSLLARVLLILCYLERNVTPDMTGDMTGHPWGQLRYD